MKRSSMRKRIMSLLMILTMLSGLVPNNLFVQATEIQATEEQVTETPTTEAEVTDSEL